MEHSNGDHNHIWKRSGESIAKSKRQAWKVAGILVGCALLVAALNMFRANSVSDVIFFLVFAVVVAGAGLGGAWFYTKSIASDFVSFDVAGIMIRRFGRTTTVKYEEIRSVRPYGKGASIIITRRKKIPVSDEVIGFVDLQETIRTILEADAEVTGESVVRGPRKGLIVIACTLSAMVAIVLLVAMFAAIKSQNQQVVVSCAKGLGGLVVLTAGVVAAECKGLHIKRRKTV